MPDSRFLEQTEQIRPGDHLVALYEREDEIVDYITSYVHTSLLRNERCVYITGDADTPRVLGQIRKMAEGIDMAGNRKLRDFSTEPRDPVLPWGVILASHPTKGGAQGQVRPRHAAGDDAPADDHDHGRHQTADDQQGQRKSPQQGRKHIND